MRLGRNPVEEEGGRTECVKAYKALQRTLVYFEKDMKMLEASEQHDTT